MEFNLPEHEEQSERRRELVRIFGEGATKLVIRIAEDNPELNEDEVIDYAWLLIPETTAYMMPASQEELTEKAINLYEGYSSLLQGGGEASDAL